MKVWQGNQTFKSILLHDPKILAHLSPEEIEQACDLAHHLRHVNHIFERVFQS